MKFLSAFLLLAMSVSSFANTSFKVEAFQNEKGIERHIYNFGNVPVHFFQDISYRVTNTGETNLTFKQAVIYGADFSAYHTCKKELLPKDRCSFTIRYNPFFEGMSSGRFLLDFNEDSSIMVDLFGTGVRR